MPSSTSFIAASYAWEQTSPAPPAVSWPRRAAELACRPGIAFAICVLAGVLSYLPALRGGLIWDDQYLVRENPFFRSPIFVFEVFRHYLFFDSFSTYYRPIQNWSYMADYWAWHGEPAGYHLTNMLLHGSSGFLLFLLLRRIFPALLDEEKAFAGGTSIATAMALLTALIWVVHPAHNAAVAYISGRADSLASVFALAAWLMSFRAFAAEARWKRGMWSAGAGLSMLLALCSKEIALIWLGLFLLSLALDGQRRTRAEKIVLFAVLGSVLSIYAALHSLPRYRAPMEGGPSSSFEERPLLMLRALGDYASLIVYPGRLYMERSLSDPAIYRSGASWTGHLRYEYLSAVGLLAALAAAYLCNRAWPGRRLRIFGAAWFFISFLPISNLFPLNAEVAEHWIYLASIGGLIFMAGCAAAAPARWRAVCAAIALASATALAFRTWVRAGDWVNAETFCLRTIQGGGATPRILSTLASVYGERREWMKQERVLRLMIERFPDFAPARINLGICLSKQGREAEAEPLLQPAHEQSGDVSRRYARTWPAALHLAGLRSQANHPEEAISIFEDARTKFPEAWELVKGESEVRRKTQRAGAAIPMVERFAANHWWHLDAWMTLGSLRYSNGEVEPARAAFDHASRLDIYSAAPPSAIAQLELEGGRPVAALDAQLRSIKRTPDEPRQYVLLAAILEKLGRKAESEAALNRARAMVSEARGGGDGAPSPRVSTP